MKLEVDLISVSQSVDFTEEARGQVRQVVTINFLGARVEVPVTEAQMQQITEAAISFSQGSYALDTRTLASQQPMEEQEHTASLNWEDTREQPSDTDLARVSAPPMKERDFVFQPSVGQLVDQSSSEEEELESEALKEQALRARRPATRSASDDDAFSQG